MTSVCCEVVTISNIRISGHTDLYIALVGVRSQTGREPDLGLDVAQVTSDN